MQLYEYSGMAATSPLDAVATPASGTGTSLTSGNVTTNQACDLLISGAAINAGDTFTWGSSFTEQFDFQNPGTNKRSFSGADRKVTTAGSYSASATAASTSAPWSMVLAAFKAAPPPTGMGFHPPMTSARQDDSQASVWPAASLTGDAALFCSATAVASNSIPALEPDGFQVCTNADVNSRNQTNYCLAPRDGG
ncbi:MAG: hypothetical protein IMZ46_05205 [Acidobacteria bacterium]|nr:hypothetical protein [Acidobacteriota bacterium]